MMNVLQLGHKQVYSIVAPCEKWAYFCFSKVAELQLKSLQVVCCLWWTVGNSNKTHKYTESLHKNPLPVIVFFWSLT